MECFPQILTDLRIPNLRGVKPSDLLGDLEVCTAFRKKSSLVTTTTTTTEVPGEDAQRGRSGSFEADDDIDNRIPSTSM